MNEHPLAAAYRAVYRRATESSEVWGERVYPDRAPAGVERPYLVYFYGAGGELNGRQIEDAELVLIIKGVSSSMAQAFEMARRINTLFNDAGQYDSSTPLVTGSEWAILTTKRELLVHLVEQVDGQQIYHAGAQYRLFMEVTV